MGIMPPLLAFLALALTAIITVTGTFVGGSNEVLDARLQGAEQATQLAGTKIDQVEITWATQTVDVTYRNSGRVSLRDVTAWDVWARVDAGNGGYNPVRLTYTTAGVPSDNEWTLLGIYLDASAPTAESHEPGIINPAEEFVLRLNVGTTAIDGGGGRAI